MTLKDPADLEVVPIIPGERLAEQAYAILRDQILNHLPPGTRLSVPDIARQLGISRSPVREAITRLEAEGLAVGTPHRGAVVAKIGLETLIEIYEIREVLEGLASRLATQNADTKLIDDLKENQAAHVQAVAQGNTDLHLNLDAAFHLRILKAAGNEQLSNALQGLQNQIRLAMSTTMLRRGGMEKALREHQAIIDAIAKGIADEAENVARRHITRLRDALKDASVGKDTQ